MLQGRKHLTAPDGRINAPPDTQLKETDLKNLRVGWEFVFVSRIMKETF
jgi:hypothetical protein